MRELTRPNRTRNITRITGRRSASTLIELLVVIALIGVLISLLIPSLKRSMELASATVCRYNLREIGHSLTFYRMENDGWLPVGEMSSAASANHEENQSWFVRLYPNYLPDPLVLTCPNDPYAFRLVNDRSQLRDPAVADFPSYGINSFIMSVGGGYLANLDRYRPSRPLDTILVADLGPDRIQDSVGPRRIDGPWRNSSLMMWGDGFDPFSGLPANPWVTTRHHHGINTLTLAGGVRDVGTAELLQRPIRGYYENCAAGGCSLCNELRLFHYSFAEDHLYWWTGSIPSQ